MYRSVIALTGIAAFWSNSAIADNYPVSDVWVSAASNVSESCSSWRRNPKEPTGNVLVFVGSKKTEFNGGYLLEETVSNLSVKELDKNHFQIVDQYFDDGEGGRKTGYKRRTYKLTLISSDKIDIKEGPYPSVQYIRCPVIQANTGRAVVPKSNAPATTLKKQATESETGQKVVSQQTDKEKKSILFIYQQYLVLKNCEANAPGLIGLDSVREKLKKFDQSIRSKGYDPDALFAESKNVPFPEPLKILLVSISMLPTAQGSNKAQLLSVCRGLVASEDNMLDMALATPEQETSKQQKIMEKDF